MDYQLIALAAVVWALAFSQGALIGFAAAYRKRPARRRRRLWPPIFLPPNPAAAAEMYEAFRKAGRMD